MSEPQTDEANLQTRVAKLRRLASASGSARENYETASLALVILHDTIGSHHPLGKALASALDSSHWQQAAAASQTVVTLFETGGLKSPRLQIAHEIEGSLLDIAQREVEQAERATDAEHRVVHVALAAFLAGAALEDGLRRLSDANGIAYDPQRASISKLQAGLFQPSQQIEVISSSENKQITSWADTRNKADHGKFLELALTEVAAMVIGVRGLLDRRLP